jgi:hypothetical protein
MCTSTLFAAFDTVSMRLNGINPELAEIIADEYTDALDNPADMLSVMGQRFYTIMSNLGGQQDRLFNNTSVQNHFQLGYFGNPAKDLFLPSSQYGAFYDQDTTIAVGNDGPGGDRFSAGATDTKIYDEQVTATDNNSNQNYTSVGDTIVSENKFGERYIETNSDNMILQFAIPILSDYLKIGARVANNTNEQEEPIKAAYYRFGAGPDAVAIDAENNSLNAKETVLANDQELLVGARLKIGDKWNVGATVGIKPIEETWERSATATLYQNKTAITNTPSTLSATGSDVVELRNAMTWAAGVAGGPGAFNTGGNFGFGEDGVGTSTDLMYTAGPGFGWDTTGALSTANDTRMLSGVDEDFTGERKDTGTEKNIQIDSYYQLNDDVRLVGALGITNQPLARKFSGSNNAAVHVVDWKGSSASQVVDIVDNETYQGTGWNDTDSMSATIGAEQNLPASVKLAYGFVFAKGNTDANTRVTIDYLRKVENDPNGDGMAIGAVIADPNQTWDPGSPDSRVMQIWSEERLITQEDDTTTYQFPIGMELGVGKRLKLRLGATHTVQRIVSEQKNQRTRSSQVATYVETGISAPGSQTLTYDAVGQTTGDTGDQHIFSTTQTRDTNYYYGAGYQWSDNLSFDILNFGSGTGEAGLLELSNWRLGATLMFGGEKEM